MLKRKRGIWDAIDTFRCAILSVMVIYMVVAWVFGFFAMTWLLFCAVF